DAAALVDRPDQLPRADRSPALAVDQLLGLEAEDVAGLADQPVLPELGDVFRPEPLDVETVARDEMLEPLDRLRRADQPAGTAPRDHAWLAHREAAADRAVLGKFVGLAVGGAAVEHDGDDLRDHVAGALDDDHVSPPHILAGDLVLVVQGRAL